MAVEFIGKSGDSREGHTQGCQRGAPFRVNCARRAQEQDMKVGLPACSLEGCDEPGMLLFFLLELIWV